MKVITFTLPAAYLEGLEQLVEEGAFPNRSEAVRIGVRDFLMTQGLLLTKRQERKNERAMSPLLLKAPLSTRKAPDL